MIPGPGRPDHLAQGFDDFQIRRLLFASMLMAIAKPLVSVAAGADFTRATTRLERPAIGISEILKSLTTCAKHRIGKP